MFDCKCPLLPAKWADPSGLRREKPRDKGLTMVIDKGVGLHAFRELLELASPFIDIYKLGFGTTALYPPKLLQQKIAIAKQHGLHIMPGGTFFEIASRHDSPLAYMKLIHSLGFNAVEISDGTFPLSGQERQQAIQAGVETGLIVYTEYGKKAAHYRAERNELLHTLHADLQAGASHVIVEARESGTVGVCDGSGNVDGRFVQDIVNAAKEDAYRLIWETPLKEQQVSLIRTLGCDVNLGNIAIPDIYALESLRRGLRGDTAALVEEGRSAPCE